MPLPGPKPKSGIDECFSYICPTTNPFARTKLLFMNTRTLRNLAAVSLALVVFSCKQTPADKPAAVVPIVTAEGDTLPGDKFGYINSLELLSLMPEMKDADQKLEAYARKKEGSFQSLAQTYQKKVQELQQIGDVITPSDQEKRVKELQGLEQRLQQMQQSSQNEVGQEKERLYAPVLAKADSVIKLVAKENGFTFIFDAPALLYADSMRNILPMVKEKLGIKDEPKAE